jgi:hypothetical protein
MQVHNIKVSTGFLHGFHVGYKVELLLDPRNISQSNIENSYYFNSQLGHQIQDAITKFINKNKNCYSGDSDNDSCDSDGKCENSLPVSKSTWCTYDDNECYGANYYRARKSCREYLDSIGVYDTIYKNEDVLNPQFKSEATFMDYYDWHNWSQLPGCEKVDWNSFGVEEGEENKCSTEKKKIWTFYNKEGFTLNPCTYQPSIIFYGKNNEEIGRLIIKQKDISFTGSADESAKVFIDYIIKSYKNYFNNEP